MIARIEWLWLKSMDWSIDSFIDLLIGLTYRWVLTICPILYVYVQSAGCTMSVRLRGVEGRVRWEAMFWSSRGSERRGGGWREKGGRGGEVGRLGASVRREESWEMRWRSNYGHHWSVWATQPSPTHCFTHRTHHWDQRGLLFEIWLVPNHDDLRAWCGYDELQEHSQQNKATNLLTALVRTPL